MIVVRELLGLEPVAGLYQPLGGRDLRPRGVFAADAPRVGDTVDTDRRDSDQLSAELDQAAARAVDLAGALRAGRLTATPETCSRSGCAYPGICRTG
jgi:hypothetical protein